MDAWDGPGGGRDGPAGATFCGWNLQFDLNIEASIKFLLFGFLPDLRWWL